MGFNLGFKGLICKTDLLMHVSKYQGKLLSSSVVSVLSFMKTEDLEFDTWFANGQTGTFRDGWWWFGRRNPKTELSLVGFLI